jgi:hypothetical protein
VPAPIFKNIAEAALRYLGVPPTVNPPPPCSSRADDRGARAATAQRAEPVVSLVATAAGTVPDCAA